MSHRFGANVALADASIAVRAGTVHALLGENGAGKTTLMRIAFGLVMPDAGTIAIAGQRVVLRGPADAIAHGIGMVHQHFSLVPQLTAAENVALGGRGQFDRRHVAGQLRVLGAESGLPVDPDAIAGSLTIAEQQRLEILKALYRRARVLILDEPTAVLAPAEADALLRWLREFARGGGAVVLITHKLREALAIADEVTVLRRGEVAVRAERRAVSTEWLTQAMLGAGAQQAAPDRTAHVPHATAAPRASPAVRAVGIGAVAGRERIEAATFTMHAGEVVGIAGVEGAGHHLLLRLLSRRAAPRAGTLALPDAIGFIPEDRHREAIVLEFTLAQNLAIRGAGRRRGGIDWDAWRRQARALVAASDVRGTPGDASTGEVRMAALSGGNQQKLVVARELAHHPALVVAENPTRGLDVRAAAAVHAQLRAAAAAGVAIVLYSADLDEVVALADRVLVVHAGHVTECARDRDAIGRAMLGVS